MKVDAHNHTISVTNDRFGVGYIEIYDENGADVWSWAGSYHLPEPHEATEKLIIEQAAKDSEINIDFGSSLLSKMLTAAYAEVV